MDSLPTPKRSSVVKYLPSGCAGNRSPRLDGNLDKCGEFDVMRSDAIWFFSLPSLISSRAYHTEWQHSSGGVGSFAALPSGRDLPYRRHSEHTHRWEVAIKWSYQRPNIARRQTHAVDLKDVRLEISEPSIRRLVAFGSGWRARRKSERRWGGLV